MFTKRFVMSAVAASMVAMPGTRAAADFADGLVGGLVGGAVSGVIVNESAKARERNRATRSTPRQTYRAPVNSVARQQVREEQTSLNYFGFPAGTPDGVRGRNTRNAVSQFQAHMGYPVTGYLADYERQFLISSYYRAQSSGAATTQLIAQRGQGTRGLLHAYRDEAVGVPQTYAAAPAPVPAAQAPVMAAIPQEAQVPQPDLGLAALPNLMASGGDGPSLASHCNQISLLTNSNGGFVTAASLTDARFALNEQFCLARTYAIAEGETMAASLKGVSPAQLEEQCRAFGPAMRDHVAALSLSPKDEVVRDVRGFVLQSGQSPAQLSGTAKICLSVGYRIDNMNVALGSALLLTALGEEVYAELMGHHLNEGFGTTRRPDLALAWYQGSVEALERGAESAFAPGDAGRTALIRKAAFPSDGANNTGGSQAVQPASTLPTFTLE
ncbi:Putative peptidoglycan binding domain-containing protein [Roseovarius marisflavi]|uniref:Putative peptidoglycan binding domain-containing protein n=1 Tax=Roseovarius marisflavi TaxID=1054996 RepID=A0A1M6W005_9RHOB|nr:peptidoglycan-binding domain-containing protein [Roseovarius marisflavi]SHK87024.1 Putative peptidoglycan binding domain-containing protein [Roseovarius marisflavi]